MPESTNQLITVDEVCTLLDIGRGTVYRLLREKEIRGFRIGNKWKITREAIDEYIERQKN